MLESLGWAWIAAPLAALASGIFLIFRGIRSMGRGRVMAGGRGVATGLTTAAAAFVAALVALNMQSYSRLTWEKPVAEITVKQTDAAQKLYDVTLTRADGAGETHCLLQGDEWILGGRVQKWQPWANTLGLNATYELDQMANKYIDAREANGKPITACDVSRPPNPILARAPEGFRAWLSSISLAEDRRFGSANYMPLADGAAYRVVITQSGFNAEAANDAARRATQTRFNAVSLTP
ncbi:MAG: hypothetical protein JNM47_17720 [Hyphomonadaceae bacterium]|nr:hypothetical protein [Hyphomonadaceae bacterium]